jgi:hypothetical protein
MSAPRPLETELETWDVDELLALDDLQLYSLAAGDLEASLSDNPPLTPEDEDEDDDEDE